MSRIGTINIIQNSQNVANNTSSITVKGIIITTGESYRGDHRTGTYTIKQGSTVLKSGSFTHGAPANSTTTLFSVTLTVTHDSNGNSGTISASYNYDSGWASGTASKTLTTIPRKSTLLVGNGTLNTAQTLTVTRQSTSFTHTITAKCGSASTTICTKSTSTSISFTPPLSWASQNTTGVSLSVTYTITTYNGNTSIGSNSYTKTCAIPASVKPSCSIEVTDSTGYASKYGGYIKGLSKFHVVVTPTIASDSPIASYNTTANGATYTSASFTTDVLKNSGSLTVATTVKDKRGRTGTDSETLTVIDYAPPIISSLKVLRCNEDGTSNDQGEWIKVTINARITALNNKNTATYKLEYKKSADSNYTETDMTNLNNSYVVTNSELIFNADTGSSYDIRLTAIDDFGSTSKSTVASTAFSLMHFNADGTGIGFGKISEKSHTADFGMDAIFNKNVYGNVYGLAELEAIPIDGDFNDYVDPGCYAVRSNAIAETVANIPLQSAGRLIVSLSLGWSTSTAGYTYLEQKFIPYKSTFPIYTRNIEKAGSEAGYTYGSWSKEIKEFPTLAFGTNFNNVKVIGRYPIASIATSNYTNCPITSGTGVLEVLSCGSEGQLLQRIETCNKTNPVQYERFYYQDAWGEWINTFRWGEKVLASPSMFMTAGHTVQLSEPISKQPNGIILVFSYYDGTGGKDEDFHSFTVSKELVSLKSGKGHNFLMMRNGFNIFARKYLYIYDDTISGHDTNGANGTVNGVTYNNNHFVLRYVIGY